MIDEIQGLINEYVDWLKSKNVLRQIDSDWVEITTPYLDRHNDYLQIYVRKLEGGGYLLTDDSYIIDDLQMAGCTLESPKRAALLEMTLNGFGVKLERGSLEVRASSSTFALRKHNLIQAMLAVDDLFYLATSTVASIFKEDVIAWMDENDIRYTPNVKFTGKSGYDHWFDFVIPRSRNEPERILRTMNRPNRNAVTSLNYAWLDTREIRPPESKAYAIINDAGGIPPAVMNALENYGVRSVPWSMRQNALAELSA
ncbi:DUF1829 domain-containing protein [Methanotrichaceae archaeon M04Ac]|uniref:DUF1829 domain-containing protein n=1 Tax=Candidatus Methanocrinis alkalitolerans TaxID=3033395 RepID=A0ABT5XHG7_9EURY|nr:DUF1829 domain-containing protein [Candidatus Methanocrinis alkalitolerans]MDF0594073.1 DUF1829 domain-containing protein [Candidatus Methanocrinis alkalitolerans]